MTPVGSIAVTWILTIGAWFALGRELLPPGANRALVDHAIGFFALGGALIIAMMELGRQIRTRWFRSALAVTDIALGFGAFAFFLNIYIKATLSPVLPLAILSMLLVSALYFGWQQRSTIGAWLRRSDTPWVVFILGVMLMYLSLGRNSSGLLYIPMDFDSGMTHVRFPMTVINEGRYFSPLWIRALWLPQLIHQWYIFVLSFTSVVHIKTLNLLFAVQIALLFVTRPLFWQRVVGLSLLSVLVATTEFIGNMGSTSMDAGLIMFSASAFVVFRALLETPSFSQLTLLTLLCGFTGGQKHFGLMYAAPVLTAAHLLVLARVRIPGWSDAKRLGAHAALSCLFLVCALAFYIHNVLAGDSLLFPFTGGVPNSYDWSSSDIHDMVQGAIPYWGHSKTLVGFFQLPMHLIQYPIEYQYFVSGLIFDRLLSAQLVAVVALLVVTLVWRRLRVASLVLPALVIIVQVVAWYRGSQIVRYLLPVLVANQLYFGWILFHALRHTKSKSVAGVMCIAMAAALLAFCMRPDTFKPPRNVPISVQEQHAWLVANLAPQTASLVWLNQHVTKDMRVLGMTAQFTALYQFPGVALCGDWFGRYRYDKYTQAFKTFLEWPELVKNLHGENFTHVLVDWGLFDATMRPTGESRANAPAFPASVVACLVPVFHESETIDVYEIKPECRPSNKI